MLKFIFPSLMIILSLGASAVYFINADVRRGVYWLAAAVIAFVVTF